MSGTITPRTSATRYTSLQSLQPTEEQGHWEDGDKTYALRWVAIAMGFTPPFLTKWRGKAHPALGRPIGCVKRLFEVSRGGFAPTRRKLELWLLSDLQALRNAREGKPPVGKSIAEAAKSISRTPSNVAQLRRRGKIGGKNRWEPVAVEMNGRNTVQFKKIAHIEPADLERPALPTDRISLPDAARETKTPLATLHTWVRRGCPLLGGKKLPAETKSGFTNHHHYRELRTIARADLAIIRERLHEAAKGWLVRDSKIFVSPAFVGDYFRMPPGKTPVRMHLSNRNWRSPIETAEGVYVGSDRRLTDGKYWHIDGVEEHFDRKKPLPPELEHARRSTPNVRQEEPVAGSVGHQNSEKPPSGRRGPRKRKSTQEVYRACYDLLTSHPRRTVMRLLRERFTDAIYLSSLPKVESQVTTYARRYAKAAGKPWPVPDLAD